MSAHPDDQLSVAGQVYFAPGNQRPRLDWGFATWRFSRLLSMRVGQVSYPGGIAGEARDVGTARPFLALPSSVYGPGSMVPESYQGLGLTGETEAKSWTVGYDAFVGELQTDHPEVTAGADYARTVAEGRPGGGLRVRLRTPFEALTFALSGAYAPPRGASVAHAVVGASAEYVDEVWRARTEYFHRQLMAALAEDAAYVEVARFLTSYLQIAALVDLSRAQPLAPSSPGSPEAMRHLEVALGVNAWVTREFVVKMAVHEVSGRRFVEAPAVATTALAERTVLYEVGAQFAF